MQSQDIPPLVEIDAPTRVRTNFDQERLQDYIDWRDSTTFMSLADLPALLSDPKTRLDPLLGYAYSVMCTSEADIKAFLCRFTDLRIFEECDVIQPVVEGVLLEWDNETYYSYGEDSTPGRVFRINTYFPEHEVVQVDREALLPVFDPNSFQVHPSYRPDYYPCLVSWNGSDDFDRVGGVKTRLFRAIPIPTTPGVITIS